MYVYADAIVRSTLTSIKRLSNKYDVYDIE